MRTVGGLLDRMIERENLLAAVWQAARGRREQPAVQTWLARLDDELDRLRDEIGSGRPRCGECITFTIHDPKERLITAPVFRERVLHHAVMNLCGPVLDRRLIAHTYACRRGKGTVAALRTAQRFAARNPWFLKLDVRKYFDSIPHEQLFAALEKVFREPAVRRILATLVTAYRRGTDHGLAIGTLVSQHLANFYLAPLDTLVLQSVRPAGYVRYMDDLALWTADGESAREGRDRLVEFARRQLGLEFKTAFLNRTPHGMDFLGHRVFPYRLALSRASRRRYVRKVRRLHVDWATGRLAEDVAQVRGAALTAFTGHADCLAWRRRILQDLGDGPQTGTACCAAAAGSTTAGTPGPATATATTPATATTTTGSVPVPAPAVGRSVLVEQARLPVPSPCAMDKTPNPCRWSVAPTPWSVAGQGERQGHFSSKP
ncbi:MAG: group II intron reverse transcriptase domain-containing protein [Verrucomicrobiales bacterium]|nr:group II intron reverse transcriptase domain-containing protein [Verrucomicrobiales bacterium]